MNAPKHKHRPCPCGCGELADECMNPRSGLNAFSISERRSVQLSELYDADKRKRDPLVARLAAEHHIPHPLHEVRYADGVLRDTTAGRVLSQGRRA